MAAFPIRGLRLLTDPNFRAGFGRTRPYIVRSVVVGVITTLVVVTVVSVTAPAALPVLGVLVVASLAAERLRCNGRWFRRGTPPGAVASVGIPSLDPSFSVNGFARHGPVFSSNFARSPQINVSGIERSRALLRTHAQCLAPVVPDTHYMVPGGFIRSLTLHEQAGLRSTISVGLSPRVIAQLGPRIDAVVGAHLARLSAATRSSDPLGLWPRPALEDMVGEVWLWTFFGLSSTAAERFELRAQFELVTGANPHNTGLAAGRRVLDQICARLRSEVSAWQRADPTTWPPCALGAMLGERADLIDDDHVVGNLAYLLHTTSLDTTGLLVWVLWHLGDNPHVLTELRGRATSSAHGRDRYIDDIVSETLRLEQSEHIDRRVSEEFWFEGFRFPKGWLVRNCVQESHRDPGVFADADRFEPGRFGAGDVTWRNYAPLGMDARSCIGEELVRTMAASVVRALLAFDLDVPSKGTRGYSEWGHWAPGEQFRVILTPRP